MLLKRELKQLDYHQLQTVPLVEFNDANIAFVVGVVNQPFKSLCVIKAGGYYTSAKTPVQLCDELEQAWERYLIPSRQALLATWQNLMATTPEAVRNQLATYQGPKRVASCGKRSFWSPRPYFQAGVWFVTPACDHIQVLPDRIQFQTHAHHDTIQWEVMLEAHTHLSVTPAAVQVLQTYVAQKAAIIQAYSVQELSELLHDQEVALSAFPYHGSAC